MRLPCWLRKESVCLWCRRPRFDPWVGKIPWRRKRLLTLVFLSGQSHGRRILVGYRPGGHKELDTTERLHFHFTFISDTPYNDDTYTNHKYINLYRKSMLIYILVYNKSHPYKRAPSWDCICKSRLFLSPVDSAACRATVCRATKSQTWPKWLGTHPNKVSLATWLTQAAVPYSPVTRV